MLRYSYIANQTLKKMPPHGVSKSVRSTFFESILHPKSQGHQPVTSTHNDLAGKVQRKKKNGQQATAGVELESYINALPGKGQPLPNDVRKYYEPKFGYNFRDVEIHDGAQAHESAANIDALAYTHANHIVFGEGQYKPDTRTGNMLLTHELTHIVQQKSNSQVVQRLVRKSMVNGCKDETESPVSDLIASERIAFTFLQKAIKKIETAEEEYAQAVHKYFTPDSNQLKEYKNALAVAKHLHTAFGFSPDQPETWDKLRIIRARFMKTLSYLESVVFDYNCCKAGEDCPKSGGHKCPDNRIAFTIAEDNPNLIILCPGFWGSSTSQGLTLAHEVMHLWSKGFLKDTTTEVFGIKKETPKFLDVYRYENFLKLLNR
ncbi:MAG TPA: DUF4157 domain-containing protein [Flavitalea sp.]|nr:DUF4157 domain-containing protein [Flavitalea sp.]